MSEQTELDQDAPPPEHGHTPPEPPPAPAPPVPTTRVRILHGNQTGQIQDLPRVEAEVAIQTGYGEAVVDEPVHDDPAGQPKRQRETEEVAERLGEQPKSAPSVAERLGASPAVKKAPESP
jgi:hypothetical protein